MPSEFEVMGEEESGNFSPASADTTGPQDIPLRPTYQWAMQCQWVWDHLGGKMTRSRCPNQACWEMWKLAKADMQGFINNIMPKAMGMLEKAMDRDGDSDAIVVKERKQIAELKTILADALVEAGLAE